MPEQVLPPPELDLLSLTYDVSALSGSFARSEARVTVEISLGSRLTEPWPRRSTKHRQLGLYAANAPAAEAKKVWLQTR